MPLQARDNDSGCRDAVVWPRNTGAGCWYPVNEVLDVSTMQQIVLKFVILTHYAMRNWGSLRNVITTLEIGVHYALITHHTRNWGSYLEESYWRERRPIERYDHVYLEGPVSRRES